MCTELTPSCSVRAVRRLFQYKMTFYSWIIYLVPYFVLLLSQCLKFGHFVFMQESSPSHRAKATQDFLRNVVPDFISAEEMTPHSADLNSLDYSVFVNLARTFV